MNRLLAPSSATLAGKKAAAVAGPPSPGTSVPPPATVVIVPVPASTRRMRPLPVSAMKRLPAPSRDASRTHELGRGGGAAVAAEPLGPGARHGRDRPRGRIHPPDARAVVVVRVALALLRDEEVARTVERDAGRGGPLRHSRDRPRNRVHPPDEAVAGVRDGEVACTVERDADREGELGRGGRPAVAGEVGRAAPRGRARPRAP